jgi:hypothetical protein
VVGRAWVREQQYAIGRRRVGLVHVAGQGAVAADLVVAVHIGHIDVENAAGGEVRRQREAEQALFPGRRDLSRDAQEWRRCDSAGGRIEDSDRAALLDDVHPPRAVGHLDHEQGPARKAGSDADDLEAIRIRIADRDIGKGIDPNRRAAGVIGNAVAVQVRK